MLFWLMAAATLYEKENELDLQEERTGWSTEKKAVCWIFSEEMGPGSKPQP